MRTRLIFSAGLVLSSESTAISVTTPLFASSAILALSSLKASASTTLLMAMPTSQEPPSLAFLDVRCVPKPLTFVSNAPQTSCTRIAASSTALLSSTTTTLSTNAGLAESWGSIAKTA